MAVRPPQVLFLYFSEKPKPRWCVAGSLTAPVLEREEFRSYGAARDWAELYLNERYGGQILCHYREGGHAVTITVAPVRTPPEADATGSRPGIRERPSSLAERRA